MNSQLSPNYKPPRLYVALDFEQWEKDHSKITEFGICTYDTRNQSMDKVVKTRHILIADYVHLKNGSYVPDNSMNFRHGETEVLDLHQAIQELNSVLRSCRPEDLFLIFHDARADQSILKDLSIELPAGSLIADTRAMFADLTGAARGQFVSLGKLLDHLNILEFHLHNAGNDAHGTMMAFMKMS